MANDWKRSVWGLSYRAIIHLNDGEHPNADSICCGNETSMADVAKPGWRPTAQPAYRLHFHELDQ
jgi:hypothetical protein